MVLKQLLESLTLKQELLDLQQRLITDLPDGFEVVLNTSPKIGPHLSVTLPAGLKVELIVARSSPAHHHASSWEITLQVSGILSIYYDEPDDYEGLVHDLQYSVQRGSL